MASAVLHSSAHLSSDIASDQECEAAPKRAAAKQPARRWSQSGAAHSAVVVPARRTLATEAVDGAVR